MPHGRGLNAKPASGPRNQFAIEIRRCELLLVALLSTCGRVRRKFCRLDQIEDFDVCACDALVPRRRAAPGQRHHAFGAERVTVDGPPKKRKPIQDFVADL